MDKVPKKKFVRASCDNLAMHAMVLAPHGVVQSDLVWCGVVRHFVHEFKVPSLI